MREIEDKIADLQEICEQLYGRTFPVTIKMNGRLTSTAGRAWLNEKIVEFSTPIYNANKEAFINDTVGHEFAHIVAWELYQDKGHGTFWKHVVQALGIQTKRLHSFATQKSGGHIYVCGCKEHSISPQRKSWMTRGKIYKCTSCGQILTEKK